MNSINPMNTNRKRAAAIAVCGIMLCAVPGALADKDADKHFKMMDANGDGQISRTEHAQGAKKMFTEADANRDGIVTVAEMEAAATAKGHKPGKHDKTAAEKIREIDQNNDGQLTAAEHEAGVEKMFAKMDTNGDGVLSRQECDEGMKMMKKGA